MKTILLIFFICSIGLLGSQNALNMVTARMAAQESAWNNGDIEEFMQQYWKSDSLTFIGSKRVTYGWQNTFENYKKSYPDKKAMGTLKFDILEKTQLSENIIYVIGKWQLTRDENPVGGHFTLVWKKIADRWVIISDHTS